MSEAAPNASERAYLQETLHLLGLEKSARLDRHAARPLICERKLGNQSDDTHALDDAAKRDPLAVKPRQCVERNVELRPVCVHCDRSEGMW